MMTTETFSKKRILITGGSGYIASNLVWHLSEYPCEIFLLSRKELPKEQTVGKATVHTLTASITDIIDWKPVLSGIDVIYHFAAQTSIYQANQDPEQDLRINVIPLIRMLETCKAHNFNPLLSLPQPQRSMVFPHQYPLMMLPVTIP